MPRGIDRSGDPNNDLTRQGIVARHQRQGARLVSQTEVTRDAVAGERISNYIDHEDEDALRPRTGPGPYTGTGLISRNPNYEESETPGLWRKRNL